MNLNLHGKVALVTGSTKGIGEEIASVLSSEDCKVVRNGRNEYDVMNDLNNSIYLQGDLTNEQDAIDIVKGAIDHFGALDILICNIGNGKSAPPGTETMEDWQKMINVNLFTTLNIINAAKSALSKSNGSIVCISSICGSEFIPGAPITYSVAKAALNAYIKSACRPLGELGIKINGIAPGNINFSGSAWEAKMKKDPTNVNKMLKNEVALKRLGTSREIANLAAYLASPISDFASGSIWTIDGGQVRS
tara:strand:- start:248 stop:994 length:747 start_codon:yes stop_codon:yes gene_type:complete